MCNAETARPSTGEPENKTASVWREFMRTFSFHDELKKHLNLYKCLSCYSTLLKNTGECNSA
ncbi:MAG: hypothetical protein RLZ62_2413 [Bacteroidota bacterium]|jgi:hypothetical protein